MVPTCERGMRIYKFLLFFTGQGGGGMGQGGGYGAGGSTGRVGLGVRGGGGGTNLPQTDVAMHHGKVLQCIVG